MSLRSQVGKVRSCLLSSFCRRPALLGDLGPVVTFTFDDFPRTALIAGATILERAGARATYYVAMGLMDTKNNLGEQFRLSDLQSLVEHGHEVAIHGFRHLSARKTPIDEFVCDVADCERAIHECIPERASANFAYPYGEATLSTKRRLGPRMDSSRGTIGGLNESEVDLNLLRANALYGSVDQADRARELIAENHSRKSWLIFYSHDVADKPSPCGCTPSLLQEVVSLAVDSGARILTIADVVTRLSFGTATDGDRTGNSALRTG